jgi:two-component sensor histidine kinase
MYNSFTTGLLFFIGFLPNNPVLGFIIWHEKNKDTGLNQSREKDAGNSFPSLHKFLDTGYHSDHIKRFFIVTVIVLFCLLIFFVNRYLAKRRLNKMLKNKYEETALYNQNLSKERTSLLAEKGNLIEQKEWLLAEIHHRVRNNLHTIVSLMESQAVYLKDEALAALEKSQHRIYAMSLIHQNMYCDELFYKVDIVSFITQLVRYIKGSYPTDYQANIQLDIEPVTVSMTQAIPLALIINEIITNAILHAFKRTGKGEILVSMHQADDNVKLVISDNGVGINLKEKKTCAETLGMVLINGLSEDINGEIMIENKQGTSVTLVFPVE